MSDVDSTLLLQRLYNQSKRVEEYIEKIGLESGGPSGPAGGGGIEARIARLEATIEHIDSQVSDIKKDVSRQLWAGIAAVGVILGVFATGYFRIDDRLTEISDRIFETQIAAHQQAKQASPKGK